MGHSSKCPDLTTRWNKKTSKCVSCALRAGHEVTPNCGYDDFGGRHVTPTVPCKPGTFNEGKKAYCETCASCPPGYSTSTPCNSTTDTKCTETSNGTTEVPVKETRTTQPPSTSFVNASTIETNQATSLSTNVPGTTEIHPQIPTSHVALCQNTVLRYSRRPSYVNAGFSPISQLPSYSDLEDGPSPAVLSAPLQTVLDNLDVLEELMILLDPESHGVKNTKHLASLLSFPSTWITYTYSMKDSKSPLKAVLEGVTSRHPDWTVGHLTKLLRQMDRNDTIAVLAKIRPCEMAV
ncbi:IGF-like family receptor 1 isoform X2 [Notolabrus celidotus]|uniref:IGF-like family receptor 1 isoform X2 n=1 Tax=Notolabrus celidotus TaxID=1203425 RepID=UPI00149079BD|nr:IGF-like family receptor 1 isoform X2 [Notolabrus celidotus]